MKWVNPVYCSVTLNKYLPNGTFDTIFENSIMRTYKTMMKMTTKYCKIFKVSQNIFEIYALKVTSATKLLSVIQ